MKVKPRNTHKKVAAKRITAPETRVDPDSDKKILLLSYIDGQSNHQHDRTTKELFLYAAGSNQEGEPADGLDRLSDTQFIIHKDEQERAIGIDIIPSRLYRSGVMPTSQVDVKTLTLQYDLDGVVCRVAQRPFNTRPDKIQAVIAEMDKIITLGKQIHSGMRIGNKGTVVSTTDKTVEIRMTAGSINARGGTVESPEELAADALED